MSVDVTVTDGTISPHDIRWRGRRVLKSGALGMKGAIHLSWDESTWPGWATEALSLVRRHYADTFAVVDALVAERHDPSVTIAAQLNEAGLLHEKQA